MSMLPRSWAVKQLAQVCLPIAKLDPAATGRETVRYVDIGSVAGGTHTLANADSVRALEAPSRARQVLASGDTVFSTVRPYLEKIAFIGADLDGEFASTGFCVLRPGPGVLPRYLFHFATSRSMLDQVLPHQRGVSYPAVLNKDVLASTIPLPPLEEQRRIVDILEDHLSRLDTAGRLLSQAALRGSALMRSALREELGYADAEHKMRLTDAAVIINGTTPRGLNDVADAETSDGAVPFWKVGDMNLAVGRSMTVARTYVQRETAERLRLRLAPAGTVVFPKRGGAIATNKKRILGVEGAFDLNTMGVVPGPALLPAYLLKWFEHLDLRNFADGSNVPQINTPDIACLVVPVPALEQQIATVNRLSEIEASLERLPVAQWAARADGLRRALLRAAFSGRLAGRSSDDDVVEELAGV